MIDYQSEYQKKLRTAEEIIDMIRDDWFVSAGQFAGNPHGLLSALHTLSGKAKRVDFHCASLMQDYPFLHDEQLLEDLVYEACFFGGVERAAQPTRHATFLPGGLGLVATKILSWHQPNMFWGMSSPMDTHGNFNIGLSVAYEMEMLEAADIVVIEVNDQAPRVFGDNTVPIRDVDFVVECSHPIPKTHPSPITDVEDAIGVNVAELIEDGSCIQLGIGNIPDAVGRHLHSKRNLSVHTELITDSMALLYDEGVITNKTKSLWKNKLVGTLILGSQELYDFINDNPIVELRRGSIMNSPYVIAQNDNQISVNTALSVDLTGQVSSESFGHRQFSATGGQFETAYGAQMSKGGKSVVALRSTAKQGAVSTIVCGFPEGTVTTLGRNDVDYVVTEFGTAALRGRSVRERVAALIAIAHPKFRQELTEGAERLGIW
jgi:acyl-CoA hydrolase